MQKQSGTFKLNAVFNLTGRGSVLMGELLNGEVNSGDCLILPSELGDYSVRINSVEYIDHLQTQSAKLGLMVRPENERQLQAFDSAVGDVLTIIKATFK